MLKQSDSEVYKIIKQEEKRSTFVTSFDDPPSHKGRDGRRAVAVKKSTADLGIIC